VHHAGVGFELDLGGGDDGFQLLSSEGPEADGDHGVQLPVALQDGDVLVDAVIRRLQRGRKHSGVPRRGDPPRKTGQGALPTSPRTSAGRDVAELLTQRLPPRHQDPAAARRAHRPAEP